MLVKPGRPIVSRTAPWLLAAATGLWVAAPFSVIAQDRPVERAGRFVMSPVDGGFARLDSETGAMSLCKSQPKDASSTGDWACTPMGDAAATAQAAQTRKLEMENKELRAEIKRMEDLLGLNGEKPKDQEKRAERPGGGFSLPSEQDVDKALSYMERMVKKFSDTMKRLEDHMKSDDGRKDIAL